MNSIGPLNNPQKKIVILSAVELGSKTAHFKSEFPPQADEMTNVVVRNKEIRGPIRFEGGYLKTVLRELVFVRVNKIGIGMRLKKFDYVKQSVGFNEIIMIEHPTPFSPSHCERSI